LPTWTKALLSRKQYLRREFGLKALEVFYPHLPPASRPKYVELISGLLNDRSVPVRKTAGELFERMLKDLDPAEAAAWRERFPPTSGKR